MEKKKAKNKTIERLKKNKIIKEKSGKDSKSDEKEEVCEIYEVKTNEKEKIVKSCGEEEIEHSEKEEVKRYNQILKNVFVGIFLIVLFIFILYFIVQAKANFEFEGIRFELVKQGDLKFYQTKIPVIYKNAPTEFNLYLRKDPRKTILVPFEGELDLYHSIKLNSTQDLNCQGDGVIAVANMAQYYQILGAKMMKDENATCEDSEGQYTFMMIQSSNETSIKKVGESCYYLNVKDCEILEVTERFILEGLIETNKKD